jgi:hypothetical protein
LVGVGLDATPGEDNHGKLDLDRACPTDKQGSKLVRWAAVEAATGAHREPRIAAVKQRVGARRGVNVGKVAAARHLLTLVYYGLRDGVIRCLSERQTA